MKRSYSSRSSRSSYGSRLKNNIRDRAWRAKYHAFKAKIAAKRVAELALPVPYRVAKNRRGYRGSMGLAFQKLRRSVRIQKNQKKALLRQKFGRDLGGKIAAFL